MKKSIFFGLFLTSQALVLQQGLALHLVSDQTINSQRNLTSLERLNNGIPVIIRHETSSKIALISIGFDYGLKDTKPGRKSVGDLALPLMTKATKSYSKSQLNQLQEKYALSLGCDAGIDNSSCAMETVENYWNDTLPILASVVKEPLYDPEDIQILAQRSVAAIKDAMSEPDEYINEVVNGIFYENGHPYVNTLEEKLKAIPSLNALDLVKAHSELLDASRMVITVVSNIPKAKIISDLNQHFGSIRGTENFKRTFVPYPKNEELSKVAANFKDIPTSYIRIKFPTPNAQHADAASMDLLFEVLSEYLHTEIRTKRGLSYSVHAYTSQGSIGHGGIIVSTPKPKEVIPIINQLIKQFKTKTLSQKEVDQFKTGFATGFFTSAETHGSLASNLYSSFYYDGTYDTFFSFPRRLDKTTPQDLKRLANQYLKDMKIGFIGPKNQYDETWFKELP